MEHDMKAIGARIRELRETHGYTTEEIREYLNHDRLGMDHYSQGFYRGIEEGTLETFGLSIINKLCNLYNCSHEYMMCKSDEYEGAIFEHTEGLDDAFLISELHRNLQELKRKQLIHKMYEL